MKSRTSLVLIELCVMLLVLALASALCLRIFLWADQSAKEDAARDLAVVQMQNLAERIKGTGSIEKAAEALGGTRTPTGWYVAGENYEIRVTPMDSKIEGLGSAYLEAVCRGTVLVGFAVSWQEVA